MSRFRVDGVVKTKLWHNIEFNNAYAMSWPWQWLVSNFVASCWCFEKRIRAGQVHVMISLIFSSYFQLKISMSWVWFLLRKRWWLFLQWTCAVFSWTLANLHSQHPLAGSSLHMPSVLQKVLSLFSEEFCLIASFIWWPLALLRGWSVIFVSPLNDFTRHFLDLNKGKVKQVCVKQQFKLPSVFH